MTIRSGRGPRDGRTQAHPVDSGAYDTAPWSDRDPRRRPIGRNGGGNGHRRGIPTGLKFLVFALVLAALVLGSLLTVLRPLVASAISDWAYDNPGALRIPFVEDIVRDRLANDLAQPAGSDPTEVEFEVLSGDTPKTLADRLAAEGLIRSPRAFVFQATLRDLAPHLDAGKYHIAQNLTPDQVVTALTDNRITVTVVPVTFREGLRIEQITAKLQTLGPPLSIDPQAFYDLVKHPPADLLAAHPWLKDAGLPKGASLEGFLAPATYDLVAATTARDLVDQMLEAFQQQVGPERMQVPKSRGLTFYQVLTLASIVEKEAVLDEERRTIAGVYQNRLNAKGALQLLNADPTVFYALDTVKLDGLAFADWIGFSFWNPPGVGLSSVKLPKPLQGYHSYQVRGLPPGPICTPSVNSIDAALEPDTKSGFYYFVAIPDGGGAHDFSKTFEQHKQKLRKYGYS